LRGGDKGEGDVCGFTNDRISNYAVLFTWFGVFVFAHDRMCGMHARWSKLSVETFDAIHYAGLSVYKVKA
jgi:hypothetical protein